MKIGFNKYNQPEPAKVYLGTPNRKIICVLNGVREDTFSFTHKLGNVCELSFDIDRYIISDGGAAVESNGYELVQKLMRIYVENIGWFICQPPAVSNDGKQEIKSVVCNSCEIEMLQHDIKNLKINKGTADSYEILVEGNVDIIGGIEFAKQPITFYNPGNKDLSLLDILMKVSGLYGWTIGYIDSIPKPYKYYENGELKTKQVPLSEEAGAFDIGSQDLYSFLTQDAAKYFNCVFLFDIENMSIHAYRPENLGKDTNINIGFRNLQQSNEIHVDDNNIFTRYYVYGNDELSIEYVNFGWKTLENLNYFLNEKYLSKEVIEKYKLWQKDVEDKREAYIENTRLYNAQLDVISELRNRVPLDGCSTDWSTFRDQQLLEAQANYQAQLKGYEQFYVDEEGSFDEEALKSSADAKDYYQIRDVILPSIQIEIDNRNLPSSDNESGYIDSYKTDWKLYGLDELQAKLEEYQNVISVCKKGGYDTPYEDGNGHTQDYHTAMYEKYLDALNQLDAAYAGGCQEAYKQRQEEIEEASGLLNEYNRTRKELAESVDKAVWRSGELYFTPGDLEALSKLYIDGDYTNSNMFLLSSDNAVTAIDEQLKLSDAASEDLSAASVPQYTYAADLDNFTALPEYRNYTDNLDLGDFIWLGIRDDYAVKLRVISMSYNPVKMDHKLNITFSNMIKSRSSRDDFSYLLDTGSNHRKNTSSGNGSDYVSNEGIGLTSGLIQKLLQNGSFKNSVNQMIENGMAVNGSQIISGSGTISVNELNTRMMKVVDMEGENAFFEYLQSKLIASDKIIADSSNFHDLSTLVAAIDHLLAGDISADLARIITLTAENVHIDEAVIRDIIASQITVSMLQSGDIITDRFSVKSEDGGMSIAGNTMQFRDSDNIVRVQIGKDAKGNFTFCLYDETGQGILIDSSGIKESAIGDGIITGSMIADHTIEKEKLGFKTVETDENGKVSITEILDENGNALGVTYTQLQNTVKDLGERVEDTASYIISVENEYQNIPCDNGSSKQNMLIEIPFSGYCGTARAAASVTASLLPDGMTIAGNTPATDTSAGMLLFNVASGSTLGGKDILTGFIPLIFTIEGHTLAKRFTWSKTNDGSSGEGTVYSLDASSPIITKSGALLSPSSISFSAYSKTGTNRKPYEGRFAIRITGDGINYTNLYMSASDEASVSVTPPAETVRISCTLYEAGNMINTIEQTTVPVIQDIGSSLTEITEVKHTVTALSDTVDKNTKAISQKAGMNEVTEAINNYDGSAVKTLRDTISEHTVSIGSISDKVSHVEAAVSQKADGSVIQELSEKISEAKQDIDGFESAVSATYATKDYVEAAASAFTQKADEIKEQVEDNKSNITSLTLKSDEISSTVSKKKDMPIASIRYIRDWLNGNSEDVNNCWTACQVNVNDFNIARGIIPAAKNETGEIITLHHLDYYTDGIMDNERYIFSSGGWQCLELDLGSIRKDIDSICVWHRHSGSRCYNHRLQVSENGTDWITLFDSDMQGSYEETEHGKCYYLNDTSIVNTFSSIRQNMASISSHIQNETEQIYSALKQTHDSFDVQIGSMLSNIENIQSNTDTLDEKMNTVQAEFLLTIDSLRSQLKALKDEVLSQSEVIQTAEEWKILFKKLSMYHGDDVPDQQTNVTLSIDGIEVSNPVEGTRSTLKMDGIKGYYNGNVIFQLEKDATITERLYAKRGADMYTMKMIPLSVTQNAVSKAGIAFVKSGGES